LRIIVLLRRLRARPDGAPAPDVLGCCDQAALRAALALKRAGHTLVAVAAGTAEREDPALRLALGAGADRALRIDDPGLEAVDYHGVARALAGAIKLAGFDLVLAGDRSEDEVQGAVGPAVAEVLGVPHLTGVLELKLDQGNGAAQAAVATRRDAGAIRTLRLPLPALLTIVSAEGKLEAAPAEGGKIEALDLEAVGIQAAEIRHRDRCVGRAHPVRVVRNATMVTEPRELVARLRDDRLLG
jgi:electron transfer flavoprotein beta subunit